LIIIIKGMREEGKGRYKRVTREEKRYKKIKRGWKN